VSVALGSPVLGACSRTAPHDAPLVLLFVGPGTSANDVAAVEHLLGRMRITYAAMNATQLRGMSRDDLRRFRLMIVPGGDFLAMGGSLTASARATVHDAVQEGLNYLGICAGAFLAGDANYNSLRLTPGIRFNFYSAAARGVRKAAVPIARPDGPSLDQYWEDGPQLDGWGSVLARYPEGMPAVVQGRSGQGWVILTGIHAEAPESWRIGLHFGTPASVDNDYAARLIDAALHAKALPHF
jgi:glutamine amidotransferase-like uncharacterized protein